MATRQEALKAQLEAVHGGSGLPFNEDVIQAGLTNGHSGTADEIMLKLLEAASGKTGTLSELYQAWWRNEFQIT